MPYPLRDMLGDRPKLITIEGDKTIRGALQLMRQYDYSQLPILDKQGNCTGMISEHSITQMYYQIEGQDNLLNLTVQQCCRPVKIFDPDVDLFDVLDALENDFAILVRGDDGKVENVITNYDSARYFKNYAEGMMRVQDIETQLIEYLDAVLPKGTERKKAVDRINQQKPIIGDIDKLTFHDIITLIESQWEKFKQYFESRPIFDRLMRRVYVIRNDLAHFRGEMTQENLQALDFALNWLQHQPKPKLTIRQIQAFAALSVEDDESGNESSSVQRGTERVGKYARLKDWLNKQDSSLDTVSLSFHDFEDNLKIELPPSAFKHRAWWSNQPVTHPNARAWLSAGWKILNVDMPQQHATFVRIAKGAQA